MAILDAHLHDGSSIPVLAEGDGPAILLPVRWEPHDPATAETMRAWGADPDYGPTLVRGLARRLRVIAADVEGHRMAHPAPETLTADALVADMLAVADAAGAERFAIYGYSWTALVAMQVALRTDRATALVMGGYPPLDGPYAEMLEVTRTAHAMSVAAAAAPASAEASAEVEPGDWDSVGVQTSEAQTRQFVTLYESLAGFDDRAAQSRLTLPRLAFAGANDEIAYGEAWGNVVVRIAEPLVRNRAELESFGWQVRVLPGLDHMSAMAGDVVLALLREWLGEVAPV